MYRYFVKAPQNTDSRFMRTQKVACVSSLPSSSACSGHRQSCSRAHPSHTGKASAFVIMICAALTRPEPVATLFHFSIHSRDIPNVPHV